MLGIHPGQKKHIRFVDAVSDGLRQSMERYEDLVIMGQDIAVATLSLGTVYGLAACLSCACYLIHRRC